MPRYIDADAMLARLEEWNTSDSTDKALYNFTLNRILEQPTADVVKAVRCKDCKYGDLVSAVNGGMWCNRYMMFSMQESYCRDGERRDENADLG